MTAVLLKQICVMFLLMGIGMFLFRTGYISEQGGKELGAILLRLVIPCVILKSYITEFSSERLTELAVSAGLALLSLLISMALSWLVFGTRHRIENFAASFSNAGFVGIPLVQAVLGDAAVFYLAAYIALLNILQWTYGVLIMTGDRETARGKAIVSNPVLWAFLLGLILFIGQIPVPDVIVSTLGIIAAMNTPLAMMILGTYLAKIRWKDMFTNRHAYLCVLLRLAVIPAVTLAVFCFLPIKNMQIAEVVLIAACTPVGANIAIFAKQYEKNYRLSVITVCLSTVLCIVTVPVFFLFMDRLLLR